MTTNKWLSASDIFNLDMIIAEETTMIDNLKDEIETTFQRLMDVEAELEKMGNSGKKPKYSWAMPPEDYLFWRKKNREFKKLKESRHLLNWELLRLKSTLFIFENGY